jgi:hypothetical protein
MNTILTSIRTADLAAITLCLFFSNAPANAGPGDALAFNATAGQCVTATIPTLTSSYTIMAWAYLPAGGDYMTSRVGVLSATNCGGSIEVTIQNQVYPGLYLPGQYLMLGRCGFFNSVCSVNLVPLDQWVHLAVTVDMYQQVSYYINGVFDSTWDGSGRDLSLGPNISLADNNVRTFNGTLDEVQIWRTALSQPEIQAGMSQTPDVSDANLVAYWAFNDGSGTTAANSAKATGSACDGTLVNSPAWVLSSVPFVPDATTAAAVNVGPAGATLTGTVNPCNLPATVCFQWGADTNYGHFTGVQSLSSNNASLGLTAVLSNLTLGVTCHFQLMATNSAGAALGGDQSFTTLDAPRAITNCCVTGTGEFQLQFTGATNSTYTVLCTTNVRAPLSNWVSLGPATETAPGQYQFTDCTATSQPARFYLLREP